MSDFHGRMINIPEKHYSPDDPNWLDPAEEHGYRIGHRDARHAAAEIALEADRRLAAAAEKIAQAEALFTAFVAESDARAQAAFVAWEEQVAQLNAKIRALLGQATAAEEIAGALETVTALARVKYGNLDADVDRYLTETEALILRTKGGGR